jgi:hypothetical protein
MSKEIKADDPPDGVELPDFESVPVTKPKACSFCRL